jgi:hypothetical protein
MDDTERRQEMREATRGRERERRESIRDEGRADSK